MDKLVLRHIKKRIKTVFFSAHIQRECADPVKVTDEQTQNS